MDFLKYPSIENKISKPTEDSLNVQWVVTEKVHGCNFQLDYDHETKEITACRRKAKLNPGEKFYQYTKIIEKYAIAMTLLSKQLGPRSFRVYGELFGGGYPDLDTMDKSKIKGKGMVQKDILYCPNIDFIVFDIFVSEFDIDGVSAKARWLNWDFLVSCCDKAGFKTVPVLIQDTFENAIIYDANQDLTKVPAMYGLPDIPGNIMEGVVIRPVKEPKASIAAEWPHDHEVREMYKIRTEHYNETKSIKAAPKQAKQLDPELVSQLAKIQGYVTTNRFNAVKSKELPISSKKEIPKYIKLMVEDIKKDAEKDGVKVEVKVYNMIKKDIAILVRKEIDSALKVISMD